MEKFVIVIREDLPPGAIVAQAVHAAAEFALAHPDAFREWAENARNVVCLGIPNEAALADLLALAKVKGVPSASFTEPDFENELTAVALGSPAITSSLPLVLRPAKERAA